MKQTTMAAVLFACLGMWLSAGLFAALGSEGSSKEQAAMLIRSSRSGAWSNPGTWEGEKVPAAGARVQIREGHIILYDLNSDQAIRSIHVAGTLSFARDRNTRLDVGLIKIQTGDDASEDGFDCDTHVAELEPGALRPALEVGTPEEPIPAQHTAIIRLTYFSGMDKKSCPAIVCCGGRMDFHGAPLSRTWVKLGATASKGAKTVTLAEAVQGWRVGDRVLVTATKGTHKTSGTRRPDRRVQEVFTEERTITFIRGQELTLDKELNHDHRGTGDFRGAVANLTRNVVVESADPKGLRGHTMYHRGSAGGISYAEFRHLGKEGLLGRYSLHYHLCGDTMRGSYVLGASIWDSHNRWLTIHGTNYLVVRDCVGYQSVGHGFFLEDGTEVYNVLDRNLAVQSYDGKKLPGQVFLDDANDGAGFWWANSLNTFTRNVACENDHYGFRYDARPIVGRAATVTFPVQQPDGSRKPTDVRTLPFVRFENNEAHCDGAYGLNLGNGVERVGPDRRHPFVIRGMKIWEVHLAFVPAPPCVLVEDMRIFATEYGVYLPNYDHHVYRNLHMTDVIGEPFNRGHDDRSIQYGPLTVEGLTFAGRCGNPLIQISDDNPAGKAVSHFRDVNVVDRPLKAAKYTLVNLGVSPRYGPTTPQGVPIYLHDYFGPSRHAKVVSTRAKDLIGDGNSYREEMPLTGDESRVTEVKGVEFPQLLDPVDDLPPTTIVTHVRKLEGGKLTVRGATADNGTVKRVVVSGKQAKATAPNFTEWEIIVDSPGKLEAHAEDEAGNVEKNSHVVVTAQAPKAASGDGPTEADLTKLIERLIELDSIDLASLVKFRAGLEPSLHMLDADESALTVLKDPYAVHGQDKPGAAGWYRLSFVVPEKIGKFAVPKSGYNLGIESNVLGSWEIYTYKNGKPHGLWSKDGMNKAADQPATVWMSNAPQPAQAGDKFTVAILAMASPLGRGSPEGFALRHLRLRFAWGHTGGRQPFYGGVYGPGQGSGLLGAREMLRAKKGDELKALQNKLQGPIARLDAVFAAADTGVIENLTKAMTVVSKEINEALKK